MVKAVLIRISTQTVIKKDNYPNKYIIPIPSLELNLKWLIINEITKPSFNPFTQKLGILEEITTTAHPIYPLLDQYRISFPIISLTAQEIIDYQQDVDDKDVSSRTNLSHKDRGVRAFDRFYAIIQRKFDNGDLTANQAKGLMENLYDALEPLYKGQWRLVKLRYSALTAPNNPKLLNIFNNIKSKIDNYINNNY